MKLVALSSTFIAMGKAVNTSGFPLEKTVHTLNQQKNVFV